MVLIQFLAGILLLTHALPLFQMLLKQEAVKLSHSFPPIATTCKAQQFEMCSNIGFIHLFWNLGHRVINLLKFFDFQKLTALLYFEIRVDPFYQVEGHTWEQYYFYLQKKISPVVSQTLQPLKCSFQRIGIGIWESTFLPLLDLISCLEVFNFILKA